MYRIFLIFVGLVLSAKSLTAQEHQTVTKYVFTLDDVVQLAKEQSLQAIQARHRLRASYFSFMEYKANFRPKLTLNTSPTTWDHSIKTVESVDKETGEYITTQTSVNTLSSTAGLSLSQNIGLTGGTVALVSDFSRIQNFDDRTGKPTQYTSTPVRLSVSQPLSGFNYLRWLKEIQPLRYEEAKQNYIVQVETVALTAVRIFFALARAQVNLSMSQTNFKNSEELYNISKGRYEIGTIAEDALLKMELNYMRAESKLNRATIDIESRRSQLRSFLGFKDNVEILLDIDSEIPSFKVDFEEALHHALTKNPDIISYNRQILEAERDVALSKSQKGITLNMDASFGMNAKGNQFVDAYSSPFSSREGINVGIRIPILDWNQARNRYRNAQSILEVTETRIQQDEIDFQQNVYLQVTNFNMQEKQLQIAAKADTIAQKGYEVSYQRYIIGKVSVTDLNIADSDKDNAKLDYMDELQNYWTYYYTVRRMTLYDFLNKKPLEEDFERIIGE